jgi:hypothetical protein
MISAIVALAQELLGLRESLRGMRRDKRERLAQYLHKIGACLEDAERDLSSGGTAARACGQLHQYAELIPQAVDKALGVERAEALRPKLRHALSLRGLPALSAEERDQLLEAAGSFIALGDSLLLDS